MQGQRGLPPQERPESPGIVIADDRVTGDDIEMIVHTGFFRLCQYPDGPRHTQMQHQSAVFEFCHDVLGASSQAGDFLTDRLLHLTRHRPAHTRFPYLDPDDFLVQQPGFDASECGFDLR